MPSIAPLPQRRRRDDDGEESDEDRKSAVALSPAFSQTSNGSKRVRLTAGDSEDNSSEEDATVNGDDAEGDEEAGTGSRKGARANHASGAGTGARTKRASAQGSSPNGRGSVGKLEHRPGAIVRVKLRDFVTYTSAEFFPGPRLNMVIGPNGTGKSTLVCAICLGLGWGPQHLGRAKDPAEFVKHGCSEATIEIELAKGNRYRRNPVICRTIKKEGNKSTFTINGEPASKAKVLELARSFSIQIDNLCQFLPQDKVAEFAALSPIELLHSTQRAAAPPEMIEWHENLKTLRAEQKRLLATNSTDREQLLNLENRQEMQREDVERMRLRAEIQKRIERLELSRPVPRYQEARTACHEVRARKRAVEKEQKELQKETEPAFKEVNDKQKYLEEINAYLEQNNASFERADKASTEILQKITNAQDQIATLEGKVEAERKGGAIHRENLKKYQQNINRLKRQMEEEPVEFDAAAFTEKIRDCVRQVRDLEDQAKGAQDRKKKTAEDYRDIDIQIKGAEGRLRNLESESGRQEEKLKHLSPDTARAWEWVKENQSKFEQKVFGPPLVECSLKDPKYADAMETLFQRNDILSFTVQCRNDFRTLQRALKDVVRVSDVSFKTSVVKLSELQAPVSDEQLRGLGFDGWAKDFLSGPEPVVAMLSSELRLHQTPIALQGISEEQHTRMTNSPISNWVTGNQSYAVMRRREYGPSATSTRVRTIRPARHWTNQPVDVSAKAGIEQNIRELSRQRDLLQAQLDEIKEEFVTLRQNSDEAKHRKSQLEQEKAAKQTALMHFRSIPTKIAQLEEKLQATETSMAGIREVVEQLRSEQDEAALEKASAALEYEDSIEEIQAITEEILVSELLSIEAMSDLEVLKERNDEVNQALQAKNAEVVQVTQEFAQATERYNECRRQFEELASHIDGDEEMTELINTVKEKTIDQLEADIDSEKARLELTGEADSAVIQEFQDRQRRIDQLKAQLAEFNKSLDDLDKGIAEIRGKWEPQLEALVKKISEAFSESFARIGCAGQVTVDKAEDLHLPTAEHSAVVSAPTHTANSSDFDQWSIRIQVKFRENEALSVLDSHRQSGGERAVSTIFYLMALQSLSASPFRVVDEINQGMDPRNERMVHERMVDIACATADSDSDSSSVDDGDGEDESKSEGDAGGQYFLITPKLLTDLVYKRGMKVLCIVSGEYVPTDYQKIDFGRCVGTMRDVLARRGQHGKGKGKAVERGRGLGVRV
ncbi:Structural maintenance of chromosomes protein 5 [Onygenales sp. PD_40]|nr:Structural maintenance of chromosomes protein 5 [Onygenales sp. PD_40]